MNKSNNLNSLSHVMNQLDAYIYVVDFQSCELLVMNEKLKHMIGNAVGKLCWQYMPFDQTGPCKFCTARQMLIGEDDKIAAPMIYEFQNPVKKEWFLVQEQAICMSDNRWARLKIMININHLKQTYEAKEKKIVSKEKMMAKMAHKIRTPLNAILGYTQMMLYKKNAQQGHREYLTAIQQCGEQVLDIINSFSNKIIIKKMNDHNSVQKRSKNRLEIFDFAQRILTNESDSFHKKDNRHSKNPVNDNSVEHKSSEKFDIAPWLIESVKQQPSHWLKESKEAIEMLDQLKTKNQINKLEKKDVKTASVLMDWVNRFDFERLQQLFADTL